ncbi:PEGA domain-containing protein [Patescibacteria group bacterium]|nr:PEGA domain-containing protein [Patescibacteria group bacterium]MBU1922153.1 PEGA domain-containing protein [Patescibacteria group bacterium]
MKRMILIISMALASCGDVQIDASAFGSLSVITEPEGAMAKVLDMDMNEITNGGTPCLFENIEPGDYYVWLEKEKYVTATLNVVIKPDVVSEAEKDLVISLQDRWSWESEGRVQYCDVTQMPTGETVMGFCCIPGEVLEVHGYDLIRRDFFTDEIRVSGYIEEDLDHVYLHDFMDGMDLFFTRVGYDE